MTDDIPLRGLFAIPWTPQDWIIVALALLGTIYRNSLIRDSNFQDWVRGFAISIILTIGLYEMAIDRTWKRSNFYLPFSAVIILSKDISDFLFNTKQGRKFVLNTFVSIIESILGKAGFEKKDKKK